MRSMSSQELIRKQGGTSLSHGYLLEKVLGVLVHWVAGISEHEHTVGLEGSNSDDEGRNGGSQG